MDEWIKKIWYIYAMDYYSIIKNEIMPFIVTGMDLEIKISEVSQTERNKYSISLICGILKRWYMQTYLQSKNSVTDVENKRVATKGEDFQG